MATLTTTVVSDGAEVTDGSAVEELLDHYQFDGITAELEPLTKPDGEEPLKLFVHGANHCGLRILKPPEDDPGREDHSGEFFEDLAEYLAEPLVVQTVGTEKQRFPAVAHQYTVFPDGPVRQQALTYPRQENHGVGAELVLHFPAGDGPTTSATYTTHSVVDVETEFGATNQVHVEYVDGRTRTFEGNGLTVAGLSTRG